MVISSEQFTQQLVESSLMSVEDVQAIVNEIPTEQRPHDGQQLARLLVKLKKLTTFQAQQIYAGKGRALVLGNYVILDKLGQGGMGMVLKAEHRRMERTVAIKILSPTVLKNPESAKRFQREVKAAAKLEHPNIVTAYDADEANGTHFLVMHYVEGIDLAALVLKQGPLPVEKAIPCVLQVARGLAYAHARGIVHRDIKPANLLVDRDGMVKILDMGLARVDALGANQDQLTGTGQIMGTVDYMAPEQAMDTKTADGRADIYSLGVTLWFLLTGRTLYEGDTVVKRLMGHQHGPIPSLIEACPFVSGDLEAIFTKMVAKTPESRYQNIADLMVDLERCQTGSAASLPLPMSTGDDGQFNEFLCGMEAASDSRILAHKTATKSVIAAAPAPATVTLTSPQAETDPQVIKATAGQPTRQAAPESQSLALSTKRDQRPLWIACGVAALLLLGLIFYASTRPAENQVVARNRKDGTSKRNSQSAEKTNTFAKIEASAASAKGDALKEAAPIATPDLAANSEKTQPPIIADMPKPEPNPAAPDVKEKEIPKPAIEVASVTPTKNAPVKRPVISLAPKVEISAEAFKFKAGSPISPRALVGHPTPLRDLRSWSVEMAVHTAGCSGIAYSPDGNHIATVSSADDSLRIWRVEETSTHPKLAAQSVFLGEAGGIWDVAWSPDGQTIAVTTHLGSNVALYSFPEGRRLRSFSLNGGGGRVLQWSFDGRWLEVPHAGRLGIIDPVSGTMAMSKSGLAGENGCWSPDGREMITIEEGGKIRFWSAIKLETTVEIPPDSNSKLSRALSWSPDGRWFATGTLDGHVKIWDVTGRRVVHDLSGEHGEVAGVAWEPKSPAGVAKHPNWPRLVSVGGHNCVVWNAIEGKKLVSFGSGGNSPKAAWSPDGKRIAILYSNRPQLNDADTGEVLSLAPSLGQPLSSITSHATLDGKTLRALVGTDLLIFNGESGEFVKQIPNVPGTTLAVSPKDDWIAAYDPAKEPGELILVDTATYEQRRPLTGHSGKITGVNFSPDASRLISAGVDGTVKIWKTSTGELVKEIKHTSAVRNAIWSPDNKTLATCAEDDVIRLFAVDTGKETRKFAPLPSPTDWGPSGIAWSSKGDLIAIAPRDAQARVLDVKTGTLSEPFVAFGASMYSVAWSGDGKQLLVGNGGYGGEIGYRALNSKVSQHVFGYGLPIQWLGDKRRVITGQSGSYPIQAVDTRKGARLGVLFPKLVNDGWVCIGSDGHYRGSEGIESHIVYVALRKDGTQTTHSAADFASEFGWKNDPSKAGLLRLDGP